MFVLSTDCSRMPDGCPSRYTNPLCGDCVSANDGFSLGLAVCHVALLVDMEGLVGRGVRPPLLTDQGRLRGRSLYHKVWDTDTNGGLVGILYEESPSEMAWSPDPLLTGARG